MFVLSTLLSMFYIFGGPWVVGYGFRLGALMGASLVGGMFINKAHLEGRL
jgi:hypothetical protein